MIEPQQCTCTGTNAGLNTCTNCPTPWPDIPGATRIRQYPDERREQAETDMLSVLPMQAVHGRCPACGGVTLFLADGGHITCSNSDCPRPDLVNELIGEIGDARTHAAYTFCSQLVGHVSMTAFAKKITEKVTAVAHRKEAVAYANEQKQRADHAEQRLARIAALADEHPAGIDTALIHAVLDQSASGPAATQTTDAEKTTRVFAALHQSAEQDVTRVINLYEQWVKAGPPPLGVPLARWWDKRLIELHDAIRPADDESARTTPNNPAGKEAP